MNRRCVFGLCAIALGRGGKGLFRERERSRHDFLPVAAFLSSRRGHATDSRRHHVIVSTWTMAWQAGYFARLNTNSSVTPAGVRGFVSFNSSSVIDVTIRR